MMLPLNETFVTIQGEGSFAGTPARFIRLQGCPVGCPWCDTKHTWERDRAHETDLAAVLAKEASSPTWAFASLDDLTDLVSAAVRHVVLTGGEPCLYDLRSLSDALINRDHTVQVETSGTQPIRIAEEAFVTVSPKIGMPGGFQVRDDALARADEIKMPVGKHADVDALLALLARHRHTPDVPVYLQPLSLSEKATALCRERAIAHNFRISLQLHQYAGWR